VLSKGDGLLTFKPSLSNLALDITFVLETANCSFSLLHLFINVFFSLKNRSLSVSNTPFSFVSPLFIAISYAFSFWSWIIIAPRSSLLYADTPFVEAGALPLDEDILSNAIE